MKASIIIRTKNEERWITSCLRSIYNQSYQNFEVILVDNESEDKTIQKAKLFPLQAIVFVQSYKPGNALNRGIEKSTGEVIVCLSAHCIPTSNQWLKFLIDALCSQKKAAGVYGRQEPFPYSSDEDKRDLMTVFGLDPKIQYKDSFFHNANSAIWKKCWREIPFDESTTNIEDRLWAEKILPKGHCILYEPKASVYHYHGIHQTNNRRRLKNVVRILEKIPQYRNHLQDVQKIKRYHITAMVPILGEDLKLGDKTLSEWTFLQVQKSNLISDTYVLTDNEEIAQKAEKYKIRIPYLRRGESASKNQDITDVLKEGLLFLEQKNIYPEIIVYLSPTAPFRKKGFIDHLISKLINDGFDSVMAGFPECRVMWRAQEGHLIQISEGFKPTQFKKPIYIGLSSLGTATYASFIRKGERIGTSLGILPVDSLLSRLEIRDSITLKIAKDYLKNDFFEKELA